LVTTIVPNPVLIPTPAPEQLVTTTVLRLRRQDTRNLAEEREFLVAHVTAPLVADTVADVVIDAVGEVGGAGIQGVPERLASGGNGEDRRVRACRPFARDDPGFRQARWTSGGC
jgi:hypothetical protein